MLHEYCAIEGLEREASTQGGVKVTNDVYSAETWEVEYAMGEGTGETKMNVWILKLDKIRYERIMGTPRMRKRSK